MSDFAEGLISAIAGGVHGGAEATGQIYEDERKNAARIETETQLAQAQAEIQLQKQKQLAVFAETQRQQGKESDFKREGEQLPETLRRAGLIEAGKTDAEKTKWNDPEYRKARSMEEGITNPDRGGALRAVQTSLAELQLARANEEAKIPAAVNKTLDSLNKRADILTTATARSDFDPTTDNGKKTIADIEGIHKQYADTVKPYLPKPDGGNSSSGGVTHKYGSDGKLVAVNPVNDASKPSQQQPAPKPTSNPGNQVDADTLAQQNAYAAQQKGVADNKASLIAKYNRDIENVKSIKDPKARDQAIANLQAGARKSGIIN